MSLLVQQRCFLGCTSCVQRTERAYFSCCALINGICTRCVMTWRKWGFGLPAKLLQKNAENNGGIRAKRFECGAIEEMTRIVHKNAHIICFQHDFTHDNFPFKYSTATTYSSHASLLACSATKMKPLSTLWWHFMSLLMRAALNFITSLRKHCCSATVSLQKVFTEFLPTHDDEEYFHVVFFSYINNRVCSQHTMGSSFITTSTAVLTTTFVWAAGLWCSMPLASIATTSSDERFSSSHLASSVHHSSSSFQPVLQTTTWPH